MMRKLVTALIVVPLLIVFVAFAVANRASVTVVFDPFDSVDPAFAVKMPLFLLVLTLIAFGIVIGGVVTWFGQRKWRVRARRAEKEANDLREKLGQRQWPPQAQLPPAEPAPMIIPPAA
jgi:uncharacterized integral membrane protein